MGRRDEAPVIHPQAFAVILHNVAGEAEGRRLGMFNVPIHAHSAGQRREDQKSHEGQHFAAARSRD
jgi:hypothetical protein